MDEVAVHVEARPEFYMPGGMDMEAAIVMARIKDIVGLTTRVHIEAPGSVERSVGKARRLVDKRPKN